MKVELLDASHDRAGFDSGVPALDRYLRETARQHVAKGVSKTYVAVDDDSRPPRPVLGYFTLSLCQVLAEELPPEWVKRLPNHIPAIKLGRLAVATARRGHGLGKVLLVEALLTARRVGQLAGGIGVFVDAKDEAAAKFYEHFGFQRAATRSLTLFMPMQTIDPLQDS